jgi:DNA-binding winged helix-turn-helix (wHTH) protein
VPPTEHDIEFGPFRIDCRNRRLTREGVTLMVGGRAFDVLMILASAPGETVGKGTLLDPILFILRSEWRW